MDRSYLSQPEVIAAAEQFVCIRLTTYEDAAEAEFLGTLVRGPVANTVFAILAPDGTPALRGRGPGRGPKDLFADAKAMAAGMDALAAKYPGKPVGGVPALPVALNVKVALAVAAGDQQPLVVVLAKDAETRRDIEAKVAALAWAKPHKGRFTYVAAASLADQPKVAGRTIQEGVLVIEPDLFGMAGKVVQEVRPDQLASRLDAALAAASKDHVRAEKTRRMLAVLGFEQGVYYETGIPVSGRGEAADRERYKARLDAKDAPAGGAKKGR